MTALLAPILQEFFTAHLVTQRAVSAATSDVLLEAAYFTPITVRRTSRRLGLRSESSLRFERGVGRKGPHGQAG